MVLHDGERQARSRRGACRDQKGITDGYQIADNTQQQGRRGSLVEIVPNA